MHSPAVFLVTCIAFSLANAQDDSPVITGRFVDAQGKPLTATVLLRSRMVDRDVTTDADGHFRCTAPGQHEWSLGATIEGRPCWFSRNTFRGGWDLPDITIDRIAEIRGTVQHRGKRLADVAVKLHFEGARFKHDHSLSVRTDADGRFRVAGLVPGSWWPMVDDPRWISVVPDQPVALGRDGATVHLEARPAARLSGVVRDQSGVPLAGATVQPRWSTKSTTTDASGRWTLTGLHPGQIWLVVRAPGMTSEGVTPPSVIARTDSVAETDITLVRVGTLALTVTRTDGAMPPSFVSVSIGDKTEELPVVAGETMITDLAPGPHSLTVSSSGLAPHTLGVQVESGKTIRASIALTPSPNITGRVCDEGGVPLPQAMVALSDSPYFKYVEMRPGDIPNGATRCDRAGLFSVATARPGSYSLVVMAPGHAAQVRMLTIGELPVAPQEFRLLPTRPQQFLVLDSVQRRALAGARVVISGPALRLSAMTDESGIAVIDGIPPGVASTAHISAPGHQSIERVWHEHAEAPLTVALHPGRRTAGRLVDGRGEAVAGALMETIQGDYQRTFTDEQGRFVFSGLPDHDASLRVQVPGSGTWIGFIARSQQHELEVVLPQMVEIPVRYTGAHRPDRGYVQASSDSVERNASDIVDCWANTSHSDTGDEVLQLISGARYEVILRGDLGHLRPTKTSLDLRGAPEQWPSHVELHLVAGITLSGMVLQADGTPASGLGVTCSGLKDRETITTQHDGTFQLTGVPPGKMQISLENPGKPQLERQWVMSSPMIDLSDLGEPPSVTLCLPAGRDLTVNGDPPVRGAFSVSLFPVSDHPGGMTAGDTIGKMNKRAGIAVKLERSIGGTSDAQGNVVIPFVPSGRYAMTMYQAGTDHGITRSLGLIDVDERNGRAVSITDSGQAGGGSISGPAPTAVDLKAVSRVYAIPVPSRPRGENPRASGWYGMSDGVVDDTGRFRLTGLVAGEWRIVWLDSDESVVWSETVELAPDQAAVIEPARDAFMHQVSVYGPDGSPLAGAKILAWPVGLDPVLHFPLMRSTRTGSDGVAMVGLLDRGKWKLTCVHPPYTPINLIVEIDRRSHTSFEMR